LFEVPGNSHVTNEFFASTTNIYMSSPAILYTLNATDKTEKMLTEITIHLKGHIENIRKVSWTITKLGVDERSPIDRLKDEHLYRKPSPLSFRKATNDNGVVGFDKKVAFPKHYYYELF